MKNKGFTLVELLVVIVIIAALAGLIAGGVHNARRAQQFTIEERYYPDQVRARAEQEQTEELRRANDLKERELMLREKQNVEHE